MNKEMINKIFDHIKHGDQEHQDWLRSELDKFVEQNPPAPKFKKPIDILKSKSQIWISEDVEMEDETSFISFPDTVAAMDELAIEFANWKDTLYVTEKISVWSKDGQHQGIFQMDNEQLLSKFKRHFVH